MFLSPENNGLLLAENKELVFENKNCLLLFLSFILPNSDTAALFSVFSLFSILSFTFPNNDIIGACLFSVISLLSFISLLFIFPTKELDFSLLFFFFN